MSFLEFLQAMGKAQLRDYLEERDSPESLPEPFHRELIEILKSYFVVGGFPEVVLQYVTDRDFDKIRGVQREILDSFQLDFSKHAVSHDILKIAALWEAVPGQLAKENKKFIFSAIRHSARAREYESALQWLVDAGLIHKSYHLAAAKQPLDAYAEKSIFKVFLLDVGLLGALSKLAPKIVLEGDGLFQEFHGALTENFVAQELTAYFHPQLYYWTSRGSAEVDFVTSHDRDIVPLEVKAGTAKGIKSLQAFREKFSSRFLLRASLRNLKKDGDFINIPLYALSRLWKLLPAR